MSRCTHIYVLLIMVALVIFSVLQELLLTNLVGWLNKMHWLDPEGGSSRLGHLTNIYDFISTSLSPITTKSATMASYTDLFLKVMMTSPQLGHRTNVCDFISTSLSPITTKFSLMVHQHALIMMTLPKLCHVTNVYDFISTSINPIANKLYRKVNQRALTLA